MASPLYDNAYLANADQKRKLGVIKAPAAPSPALHGLSAPVDPLIAAKDFLAQSEPFAQQLRQGAALAMRPDPASSEPTDADVAMQAKLPEQSIDIPKALRGMSGREQLTLGTQALAEGPARLAERTGIPFAGMAADVASYALPTRYLHALNGLRQMAIPGPDESRFGGATEAAFGLLPEGSALLKAGKRELGALSASTRAAEASRANIEEAVTSARGLKASGFSHGAASKIAGTPNSSAVTMRPFVPEGTPTWGGRVQPDSLAGLTPTSPSPEMLAGKTSPPGPARAPDLMDEYLASISGPPKAFNQPGVGRMVPNAHGSHVMDRPLPVPAHLVKQPPLVSDAERIVEGRPAIPRGHHPTPPLKGHATLGPDFATAMRDSISLAHDTPSKLSPRRSLEMMKKFGGRGR